jgi:hypothetical protein
MKRDKMKINRRYGVCFRVYFDPTMWISLLKTILYYNNIGPKGCKLAS